MCNSPGVKCTMVQEALEKTSSSNVFFPHCLVANRISRYLPSYNLGTTYGL